MNDEQAQAHLKLLRAAAVPQELEDPKIGLMLRHLQVLPLAIVQDSIAAWISRSDTDGQGRRVPKFLNTIEHLLDACGIPDGADRATITKAALQEGCYVLPTLEIDRRWRIIEDPRVWPHGVAMAWLQAGHELPRGVTVEEPLEHPFKAIGPERPTLALGEAEPLSHQDARAVIKRALDGPQKPAVRRGESEESTDVLQTLARYDVPPVMADAIQRLVNRADALEVGFRDRVKDLDAERAVMRETMQELEDAFVGDDSPAGILEAIRRLSKRLAGSHSVMFETAVMAVARAWHPGLNDVRTSVSHSDPLVDGSPVTRVVVDCRAKSQEPVAAPKPPRPSPRVVPERSPQRLGDALSSLRR